MGRGRREAKRRGEEPGGKVLSQRHLPPWASEEGGRNLDLDEAISSETCVSS